VTILDYHLIYAIMAAVTATAAAYLLVALGRQVWRPVAPWAPPPPEPRLDKVSSTPPA
jgi:hypothetical protein